MAGAWLDPELHPNFVWDLLGISDCEAGSLRLVSRAWRQFISQRVTTLRVRLGATGPGGGGRCDGLAACKQLPALFPSLEALAISCGPGSSSEEQDAVVQSLALPKLQALDLSELGALTPAGLAALEVRVCVLGGGGAACRRVEGRCKTLLPTGERAAGLHAGSG